MYLLVQLPKVDFHFRANHVKLHLDSQFRDFQVDFRNLIMEYERLYPGNHHF